MDLKRSDIGKQFIATINGDKDIKGRIQFEEGTFYLCQKAKDGFPCTDKLGFEHSWSIKDGSESSQKEVGVRDLKILNDYTHLIGKEVYVAPNEKRILIADLGEKVESGRFICVTEADTKKYLNGEQYNCRSWDSIQEIPTFEPIKVQLNAEYSATVNEKDVVVGCQHFQFESIQHLMDAINKVKASK